MAALGAGGGVDSGEVVVAVGAMAGAEAAMSQECGESEEAAPPGARPEDCVDDEADGDGEVGEARHTESRPAHPACRWCR